jgi:tol-pal system protein YbgF
MAATALLLTVTPALAQSNAPRPEKGAAAASASAAQPGDGGLKSRVDTLEEQLVDMQVVVGTLESLAKNGGSAPAAYTSVPTTAGAGGGGGADAARIDGLETQVRALTAQVQQLSDQIRSRGGLPRRSDIPAATTTADAGTAGAVPADDSAPQAVVGGPPSFGSTTVSSGATDPINGLLKGGPPPGNPVAGAVPGAAAPVAPNASPVATAALPPAGQGGGDPKQLYETAYGYLLQRDYGAAEVAFDDFLKKFPTDSLSGNAQYWLGETHFVRGQYKAAAESFLKGYQTYAQSAKAPDSLLKLAMSLDRLGQKDAACSSFAELSAKFPEAPQSVKARAQSERQRVGCR